MNNIWEEKNEGRQNMTKKIVDLSIAGICIAIFGIAWSYAEQVTLRTEIMWTSGLCAAGFGALAFKERRDVGRKSQGGMGQGGFIHGQIQEKGQITELVLLSEENTEMVVWGLYGKTALVIGRDVKENQVDIDLSKSPYAAMVDIEHAVMNFSAGKWYVEDLGSINGLRVKKAEDGKTYQLSANMPCCLERMDCIFVGLNRLLVR